MSIDKEKYYSLFDQATDPIMITDFNGNFIDVNVSLCKMFGYSREELLTMNIKDLIDAEEFKVKPIRFDLLAVGQHIFNERNMVHRNGTVIAVEANVKKFDENTVMAIARDVTEIRKAHRIIQESEARFRAAFEGSAMGMALISLNGNWLKVNKEFTSIIGYTNEELFSMSIQDLSYPEDLEQINIAMQQLLKGDIENHKIEKRCIHKNGHPVWVHMSVSVIKDIKNIPLYYVAHVENITQRKNEEMYREKISKDLLMQNKDLEQFAYIVSHNLRAPIANIIGLVKILNDDIASPEEIKFCLTQIDNSVLRLDHVITDLSYVLQIKREISERKEPVIFADLITEIKSSIQNLIQKEEVQIATDFSVVDKMDTIKSYLYSIFYNLISNSIKYRRSDVAPYISIKTDTQAGKLKFVYRDNGMGIDMKRYGAQVFSLYKRFHPQVEGKGMGLFMVKTQIETLGGTISIESMPNEGTQFVIEF